MKIWIVTGKSESGDNYKAIGFRKKPSEKQLKKIAHSWDGDEKEEAPGDYGSYVYLDVYPIELDPIEYLDEEESKEDYEDEVHGR